MHKAYKPFPSIHQYIKQIIVCCGLWLQCTVATAQEFLVPLDHNSVTSKPATSLLPTSPLKTTALTLPFFEDFATDELYPDPSRWTDRNVYINNTMAVNPITRGVATFDALNALGGPYDSVNFNALVYADSLTSQPLDLSTHHPADSIYLSFFYQPQGNGFSPEEHDSLMLYLKTNTGTWIKHWAKAGSLLQPFQQVMIPVKDSAYLHNDFQFRFVNKASINLNDDVWNLDYIRMAAGRHAYDTLVDDVATTDNPPFLLNDYTSVPYRQFTANSTAMLAADHYFTVRNNYNAMRSVLYGYTVREAVTNTPLFTSPTASPNIPGHTAQDFQFPLYPTSFTPTDPYDRVVFEQLYFATPGGGMDPAANDTIIHRQVFDNYLAYDDGTAEKSYFLKQFATLPAKLAIEFHLNQPDTIQGVAVYFGRQVPLASNKYFALAVYQDIAVNGGTDQLIYEQDLLFPGYVDTVNRFWIYRFDNPVAMPAGTFFLASVQPASSGSDSIYYGLDVNRVGTSHIYYNTDNFWVPSLLPGAVMIRPILGKRIQGTHAQETSPGYQPDNWYIYPNPATDKLFIIPGNGQQTFHYTLTDIHGRMVKQGNAIGQTLITVSDLFPGTYILHTRSAKGKSVNKISIR